jgi:hypothetical protein
VVQVHIIINRTWSKLRNNFGFYNESKSISLSLIGMQSNIMKLRLFWNFYLSNVYLNLLFPLALYAFLYKYLQGSLLWIMMITPLLSLVSNEMNRTKEYYFYYNRGISKIQLLMFSIVLNATIAKICLYGLKCILYAKPA